MLIPSLLTTTAISILLIIPAAAGTIMLAAGRLVPEKITRLLAGTVLGWAALTLAAHLLGALLGSTPLLSAVLLAGVTVAASKLLPRARASLAAAPLDRVALILCGVLLLTLSGPALHLLIANEGGWATYVLNAYGDLGFHVASLTTLRDTDQLIPDNPILAGQPLIYPFMANRFSALLVNSGATIPQAIVIPAVLLIPLALTLLYRLARSLTASTGAAVVACALILFAGSSFGWLSVIKDYRASEQTLGTFLAQPPRDYTGHSTNEAGYYLTNPLISMFLPQRAFLFGLPLTLVMLLLLRQGMQEQRRLPFIISGLIAGALPLFHAHSALAGGTLILAWIAARPTRHWLTFISTAVIAGLPAVLYYASGDTAASALPKVQWWWMAHDTNPLIFWLKNSGLIVPFTLLGFFLPAPRAAKIAAGAGLALFAAANIWRFATWEWDNTKLLIYWLIFTAPLLGALVWQGVRSRRPAIVAASVVLLAAHTAAGALDVTNLMLPGTAGYLIWDTPALEAAKIIREHTPPGAAIITAPIHNAPPAVAGRPIYLGFPGHVWSHGGDYLEREAAIRNLYQGRPVFLAPSAPPYILVGPVERQMFEPLVINPAWQLLADTGTYQLYKQGN